MLTQRSSEVPNYKLLAAKRLAIDPNALLFFLEADGKVFVTTPDGVGHAFTCKELTSPAVPASKPAAVPAKPKPKLKPKVKL